MKQKGSFRCSERLSTDHTLSYLNTEHIFIPRFSTILFSHYSPNYVQVGEVVSSFGISNQNVKYENPFSITE
jgi:hypothetical protein